MILRPISKRCMSKVAIDRSTRGACTSRPFSSTNAVRADFTHAVIGGGAVGLAIARRLAARDGTSTLLVERNSAVGMETSSRNSEVRCHDTAMLERKHTDIQLHRSFTQVYTTVPTPSKPPYASKAAKCYTRCAPDIIYLTPTWENG